MIGIVVVSHSYQLGHAAVALASEMIPADARPAIAVAAGLDEETFGTDAMAIMDAILEVDSGDGVLVLMDLGSAILSAETALEFLDDDLVARVKLSTAPLVEGLVAAVVTASTGASVAECDAEAVSGLGAKSEHLGTNDGGEGYADVEDGVSAEATITAEGEAGEPSARFSTTIANPHGLHARPAATLVAGLRGLDATVSARNTTTGRGPVPASSLTKIASLGLRCGDVLEVEATGIDRDAAIEAVRQMAANHFGESLDGGATVEAEGILSSQPQQTPSPDLDGASAVAAQPGPVAVSTGDQIVIGEVFRLNTEINLDHYCAEDPDTEVARFNTAVEAVADNLAQQSTTATRLGNHKDAAILDAQQLMLADPHQLDSIREAILSGKDAVGAVDEAYSAASAEFNSLSDPYLRQRGEDIRSLRRLLLAYLLGLELETRPDYGHVLVIDELDATTAAQLDPSICQGVVTVKGGATGHGAIIANSRGVPVLLSPAGAADLATGDRLAFDPRTQTMWVSPDDSLVERLRQQSIERERSTQVAMARAHEPAITTDGVVVKVEANIGVIDDARVGADQGAEGSGVVRTEVLFSHYTTAPSADEQARAFIELGRLLDPHPITIRTWDVGGDKSLPFFPGLDEQNPFLGERGIRMMKRVPELFGTQLRAICRAADQVAVRVMFPMVTEPDEVRWALSVLDQAKLDTGFSGRLQVGIMVEVPAVALRIGEFEELVDFVSIGTNDLAQYVSASDRGNAAVSHLAWASPALLSLIEQTASGMGEKPVAVCGDLASSMTAIADLVSRGVTELSVRPPLVPLIKQAVRECSAN